MNVILKKVFLSDKVLLGLLFGACLLIVVMITTFINGTRVKRDVATLSARLTEIHSLSSRMVNLRNQVSFKEKKLGLTKTAGPVSALEKILDTLSIKATALKPLEKTKSSGFFEDDARLEISDIDLNEIVNLLYRIEHDPAPLKIKSGQVLTGFTDPSTFTLTLTVSMLSSS